LGFRGKAKAIPKRLTGMKGIKRIKVKTKAFTTETQRKAKAKI